MKGDGGMGRWGDGEMGRWGDKAILRCAYAIAIFMVAALNKTMILVKFVQILQEN